MDDRKSTPLFEKTNLVWMAIGIIVMGLGLILMSGGKSDNPGEFDADAIYSATRITIAPLLVLAGLAIEGYAIFRKPKKA